MKKVCIILGMMLFTILLVYGILAYCVFFYYGPRIAKEETRQAGWAQAVEELENECRQTADKLEKQKAKLEQNLKIEKSRIALLEKGLKGKNQHAWSDYDWKRRTENRLIRAQEALDLFEANHKDDPKERRRILELRQQLEALRARQQELQDLYERRDKLMVWPLPLIAPYFEKETKQEQTQWN